MEQSHLSELEKKLKQYKETLQSLKGGHVVDDYLTLKEELTNVKENQILCLEKVEELSKTLQSEQDILLSIEHIQTELQEQKNQQQQLLELVEQILAGLNQEEENKSILANVVEHLKSYDEQLKRIEERMEQETDDVKVETTKPIAHRSYSDYKQLQKLIETSKELHEDGQYKTKRALNPLNKNQNEKTKSAPNLPPIGKTINRTRITRKEER